MVGCLLTVYHGIELLLAVHVTLLTGICVYIDIMYDRLR
jgi:hypothetical protein